MFDKILGYMSRPSKNAYLSKDGSFISLNKKKNWCSQEREKLREDLAKEIKMVGYFALNGDVSFIMKPSLPSLPQPLQNNWCEWIYWGNW